MVSTYFKLPRNAYFPKYLYHFMLLPAVMRVPVPLHPHQSIPSVFLILAFLIDMRWYHVEVLMCTFLMTDDEDLHVLICHLQSFKIFCPFLNQVDFLTIAFETSCIQNACPWSEMFGKHFLPLHGLSFCSLNSILQRVDIFYFDQVQLIKFFFFGLCFWGCI